MTQVILAFVGGTCFGAVAMALLAYAAGASRRRDNQDTRRP
jgi:acyl-coenzyme A thioesterase PaaI-like protein